LVQKTGRFACIPIPTYCLRVDSIGNCLRCTPGNVIFNSRCAPGNSIANCQNYSLPSFTCLACVGGYYLGSNNICTPLPPNCLNVDSTGNCQQCLINYTLIAQNCVKTIPNCGTYSTSGQQCLNCNSGYIPFNGLCVIPVPNCVSYNTSSLLCSGCVSNYYLVLQSGLFSCVLLPNYCLTVNYLGNCLSCTTGNVIYNFRCVPRTSIVNCQNYSLPTFACLVCVNGYYLGANNICTALPPNCANVNANGICQQCASGYTLIGQSCFATISNCGSYNSTGQCL
jgi:hypothetical protein